MFESWLTVSYVDPDVESVPFSASSSLLKNWAAVDLLIFRPTLEDGPGTGDNLSLPERDLSPPSRACDIVSEERGSRVGGQI